MEISVMGVGVIGTGWSIVMGGDRFSWSVL